MSDDPEPRIARVEVRGLFDRYDHVFELRQDARATILHGSNGVGKTAVLRMLQALLTGDHEALARIPFRDLRVDTGDDAAILVESSVEVQHGSVKGRPRGRSRTIKTLTYLYTTDAGPQSFDVQLLRDL